MTDIQDALLDPAAAFRTPEGVLRRDDISRDQKIEILRRWEYDARELAVAEEENMVGGPPNLLDQVLDALRELDAEIDAEHSAPTKHGGI